MQSNHIEAEDQDSSPDNNKEDDIDTPSGGSDEECTNVDSFRTIQIKQWSTELLLLT